MPTVSHHSYLQLKSSSTRFIVSTTHLHPSTILPRPTYPTNMTVTYASVARTSAAKSSTSATLHPAPTSQMANFPTTKYPQHAKPLKPFNEDEYYASLIADAEAELAEERRLNHKSKHPTQLDHHDEEPHTTSRAAKVLKMVANSKVENELYCEEFFEHSSQPDRQRRN
ncbi:hypothetical protein BDZ45DRAFT_253355 [Acephala macrosclerotiorum]|nr:hypothetical protein BDZ45DRAFT_253355 [Acephala macrosclerotiorum]